MLWALCIHSFCACNKVCCTIDKQLLTLVVCLTILYFFVHFPHLLASVCFHLILLFAFYGNEELLRRESCAAYYISLQLCKNENCWPGHISTKKCYYVNITTTHIVHNVIVYMLINPYNHLHLPLYIGLDVLVI